MQVTYTCLALHFCSVTRQSQPIGKRSVCERSVFCQGHLHVCCVIAVELLGRKLGSEASVCEVSERDHHLRHPQPH